MEIEEIFKELGDLDDRMEKEYIKIKLKDYTKLKGELRAIAQRFTELKEVI